MNNAPNVSDQTQDHSQPLIFSNISADQENKEINEIKGPIQPRSATLGGLALRG